MLVFFLVDFVFPLVYNFVHVLKSIFCVLFVLEIFYSFSLWLMSLLNVWGSSMLNFIEFSCEGFQLCLSKVG